MKTARHILNETRVKTWKEIAVRSYGMTNDLTIGEYICGYGSKRLKSSNATSVSTVSHDATAEVHNTLQIFLKVNRQIGLAIPNKAFWDLWHSAKQKPLLIRLGLIPKKIGGNWYVNIPVVRSHGNGTRHVRDILGDMGIENCSDPSKNWWRS